MVVYITENSDFLSALELASDKRQKLSMDVLCCLAQQKMVIKKNIKYKARRKLTNPKQESPRFEPLVESVINR